VAFPLPLKNYNDLRADTVIPRLLIVVVLPQQHEEWLAQSEDELRLRRCGYFFSLFGQSETDNATSVTVHLARTGVFTSEQLRALMGRAERGEPL